MEFSNPFDNPQGQFAILQNHHGEYSLWPQVRIARWLACDLRATISARLRTMADRKLADACALSFCGG